MEFEVYAGFLAIAAWAMLAYALSATARRLRQGFGKRPVAWLDSLQRRTAIIAKSTYVLWLCIVLAWFVQWNMTKRPPRSRHVVLIILTTGVCIAVGNMFHELSGYAKSEIQARMPSRHGETMKAPRFVIRDLVGPIQIAIFLLLVIALPRGPHRHEIIMGYILLSLITVGLVRGFGS
jgi:hypothetical protein